VAADYPEEDPSKAEPTCDACFTITASILAEVMHEEVNRIGTPTFQHISCSYCKSMATSAAHVDRLVRTA
jgi:hypothetical protein